MAISTIIANRVSGMMEVHGGSVSGLEDSGEHILKWLIPLS